MQGKHLRYISSTVALEQNQSPVDATETKKEEDDPDTHRESPPSHLTLTKAFAVIPCGPIAYPLARLATS